jgi:hypothetical protein
MAERGLKLGLAAAALAAGLSGCGGLRFVDLTDGIAPAAAEGSPQPLNGAEAEALADEAAADEAADTSQFGGNAAAGETGNLQ